METSIAQQFCKALQQAEKLNVESKIFEKNRGAWMTPLLKNPN